MPNVRQKLQTLVDVGLGYVHLSQSATALSPAAKPQRMKLAREGFQTQQTGHAQRICSMSRRRTCTSTMCRKLLEVLHRLADLGNSVIIIEHNLDVIRNADWILDLGPEGGEDGGRIVGAGASGEDRGNTGLIYRPVSHPLLRLKQRQARRCRRRRRIRQCDLDDEQAEAPGSGFTCGASYETGTCSRERCGKTEAREAQHSSRRRSGHDAPAEGDLGVSVPSGMTLHQIEELVQRLSIRPTRKRGRVSIRRQRTEATSRPEFNTGRRRNPHRLEEVLEPEYNPHFHSLHDLLFLPSAPASSHTEQRWGI